MEKLQFIFLITAMALMCFDGCSSSTCSIVHPAAFKTSCSSNEYYCKDYRSCNARSSRCTNESTCINDNCNCDSSGQCTFELWSFPLYPSSGNDSGLLRKKRFSVSEIVDSAVEKIKDGVNAAVNAVQKLIDRASDPRLQHDFVTYFGYTWEYGCYGLRVLDMNDPKYKGQRTTVETLRRTGTSSCSYEELKSFVIANNETIYSSANYNVLLGNCQDFAQSFVEYLLSNCTSTLSRHAADGSTDLSDFSGSLGSCSLGCDFKGQKYKIGNIIAPNCSTRCTCKEDGFQCTNELCLLDGSSCTAHGLSHYSTFDSHGYSFMGNCENILSKPCDSEEFIITGIKELLSGISSASEISGVRIIAQGTEIKLERGHVYINGAIQSITGDGLVHSSNGVEMYRTGGSIYVLLKSITHPVGIRWNGRRRVQINVADEWRGKLCGLCGNHNNDDSDDFMLPDGSLAASKIDFGDSWEYSKTAKDCGVPAVHVLAKCPTEVMKVATAVCSVFNHSVFDACSEAADSAHYMEACVSDYCHCAEEDKEKCFCDTVHTYAAQCASKGIIISNAIISNICSHDCPAGMVYQQCGPVCPQTCDIINGGVDCIGGCVEGCFCPSGQVLLDGNCTSVETIKCPVPQCAALTAPSNGWMTCLLGSDNQPTDKDTCIFGCDPNYQLVGSNSRTCEVSSHLNKRWTGSDTECKKITCPVLTATTNGRITCSLGSDNQPTNGDICFFTCNSGYVLDGSATRVCLSTHLGGSWTGNDVVCNTVPQCPALTSPTNGRMTCSLGSDNLPTNRDTCAFTCDANYQLVGSSSRTCEAHRRKWTGNDALCKKIICPALTDPTNGRITCSLGIDNQPTNGDICSFTCNSGYRLRGSTSRVCLSSPLGGSWTGSYTSCSEVTCPNLSAPTNGRITCTLGRDNLPTNGDACSFTCNSGYTLHGSTSRICLSQRGGSWTGSHVFCNEVPRCPALAGPGNGYMSCSLGGDNKPTNGDKCSFSCLPHYYLVGSTSRTCVASQLSKTWTGTTSVCRRREYITGLQVVFGRHTSCYPGYTRINIDLNWGAGGEYIYLCYRKSTSGAPITDIAVIAGGSSSFRGPSGYTRIFKDLNKGSGGDYIYLYYSTQYKANPIRDVDVVVGRHTYPPAGWQRIETDVNKSVGGKYIYIAYRR